MEIVIDGIIYRDQAYGGISRIFNEILPRICTLAPDFRVKLLTLGRLRQAVPAHPHITHRKLFPVDGLLRPHRLWWPVLPWVRAQVQWLALGASKGRLWHSTYYTLPKRWDGSVVVTVVDMIHERFPQLFNSAADDDFRRLKRRAVAAADAIICISESTRHDLECCYSRLRGAVHVIPLACDQHFQPLPANTPMLGSPFLLYVGDRNHYKNFWAFLEAYCVWPGRQAVEVIVVGRPWKPAEAIRLSELGLADRVRNVGAVDDNHLCGLYNRATAFVYPSLAEGFGIPLLEAMACGCPIVASDIPSTHEVAGDCPVYFDLKSRESLLVALETTLADGRREERVRCGLQRAHRYSWDETARQTLGVYQRCATGA